MAESNELTIEELKNYHKTAERIFKSRRASNALLGYGIVVLVLGWIHLLAQYGLYYMVDSIPIIVDVVPRPELRWALLQLSLAESTAIVLISITIGIVKTLYGIYYDEINTFLERLKIAIRILAKKESIPKKED